VWVETVTGRRTVVSSPPAGEPDVAAAAEFGRSARVLHLDGWGGEAAVAAAEATRENGGLVTLDCGSAKPATARLLPLANVLNAPRRFVRTYCGTDDWEAGARALAERGPRLVTVTDGEHGAGVYADGTAVWLSAFPVRAVDTCGAGDVFCGGLIYAVLIGLGPVEALRFATATAAVKVSRPGNREALAGREEVERLLEAVH
jgi:sugar/nucleoside kinase (ribokinase family)